MDINRTIEEFSQSLIEDPFSNELTPNNKPIQSITWSLPKQIYKPMPLKDKIILGPI